MRWISNIHIYNLYLYNEVLSIVKSLKVEIIFLLQELNGRIKVKICLHFLLSMFIRSNSLMKFDLTGNRIYGNTKYLFMIWRSMPGLSIQSPIAV